jgi:ADP-ribose pyrophosphatase YjhB (NUDIX family)
MSDIKDESGGRPAALLDISRELAAIAQTGLTYAKDPYDRERYARLRLLTSAVLETAGVPDFRWPDELGYPTPKVDVRGAIFEGGQVLLIKEISTGRWTLPGGWADINLSPRENVEKECREESGYTVTATRLTALLDRARAGYPPNVHSIYKLFFLCTITGGEPTPSIESSHVEFFPVHALPELDLQRVRQADILHAYRIFKGETAGIQLN